MQQTVNVRAKKKKTLNDGAHIKSTQLQRPPEHSSTVTATNSRRLASKQAPRGRLTADISPASVDAGLVEIGERTGLAISDVAVDTETNY